MKMPGAEFDGGGPSRLQSARLVAAVAELKQLRSKRQPADHHSVSHLSSVISIGEGAFSYCTGLISVYFLGDAPNLATSAFGGETSATIYYLPGNLGWLSTFDGPPTAVWRLPDPLILTSGPDFGIQTNGFGFRIFWATNASVVVEACTNLGTPIWSPVRTNTLSEGWCYFSDSQWTNYTQRFYRLQVP